MLDFYLFFLGWHYLQIVLIDVIGLWIPKSRIFKNNENFKFEPSWPHSKALTIKPSPHVMTKNDITKYINTYFEQNNELF